MSAENNKKLMQEIFTKLAEGDGSMFVEHLADDVSMTVTGQYSWSRTFTGKESVLRDLYAYVGALLADKNRTRAFHFLADGDWVVVEAQGDMITKAGDAYQNHYCLLYRLENEMIVEMKEYQDSVLCELVLGKYPSAIEGSAPRQWPKL